MNFKEFEKYISMYFVEKGWNFVDDGNKKYLEKNYNSNITNNSNKHLFTDINLYNKLIEIFKINDLELEESCLVKNKYKDTDFIVAGLQKVNDYLYGNKEIRQTTHTLLQPVIRLNNIDKCGIEEGYISSFINICTIDIDTNINAYLLRINQWISILSALSLHSSGLKIILKNKTTKYNGVGIEFNYKGIDLGQANLYNLDVRGKTFFVTDVGLGYERILWLLNNLKNFYVPLFPKYEILKGNNSHNDKLRTATLMVMNGIYPTSNGIGSKCRKLLKDASSDNVINNIDFIIEFYYKYYAKFLKVNLTYEDTLLIIRDEINNIKKYQLCLENDIKYKKEYTLEQICEEIILKKNRR